jgi:2-polyprenyl-3-methyl-5-hydroxy-6-metoxy-1,4-benzoquinol methylase
VLDIGMSYQTVILDRALPNVRIDCLGFERDDRYKTWNLAVFHKVDLNDLSALKTSCVGDLDRYDLVVCMEVLEHLYTPPSVILEYFAAQLAPGGVLVVTTPNAAWLKNRIKLLCGKNPFEMLTSDRERMGHVREYTKEELEQAFASAGLRPILFERRGLYRFNNLKDSIYSWVADHLHGSLRRTLVAVYEK